MVFTMNVRPMRCPTVRVWGYAFRRMLGRAWFGLVHTLRHAKAIVTSRGTRRDCGGASWRTGASPEGVNVAARDGWERPGWVRGPWTTLGSGPSRIQRAKRDSFVATGEGP